MGELTMVPVNSTNLLAVGYESETLTLYVKFHNGRTYKYDRVPEQVYLDLLEFDKLPNLSVGQFFEKAIKGGRYKYSEVA